MVALSIPIRSETLKAQVIALLTEELESEVTIEKLEGRVFPRVAVSGRGRRHPSEGPDRRTAPDHHRDVRNPRVAARPDAQTTARRRSAVEGIAGQMPPRDGEESRTRRRRRTRRSMRTAKAAAGHHRALEAPDTVITLIPKRAGKQPKVFTVHHLVMDVARHQRNDALHRHADKSRAKGRDRNLRHLRPVERGAPARTPITGKYLFANANLDTIKGLAGILSSTGEFKGPSTGSR